MSTKIGTAVKIGTVWRHSQARVIELWDTSATKKSSLTWQSARVLIKHVKSEKENEKNFDSELRAYRDFLVSPSS